MCQAARRHERDKETSCAPARDTLLCEPRRVGLRLAARGRHRRRAQTPNRRRNPPPPPPPARGLHPRVGAPAARESARGLARQVPHTRHFGGWWRNPAGFRHQLQRDAWRRMRANQGPAAAPPCPAAAALFSRRNRAGSAAALSPHPSPLATVPPPPRRAHLPAGTTLPPPSAPFPPPGASYLFPHAGHGRHAQHRRARRFGRPC